ncbi:MAG: RNA polymerase sigma-70 factor [Tannerella sp.]|jgi:RNA polymerase sigma-70 factor (ECF subfamily)|nr:RNA polymerase sigma-70 factor [Tannerella sp.]
MSDKEQGIIDLLKIGDNRAYKYLYDKHYALLCRIAYEFLKDDFLAQTVAADLITHIYENRQTLTITFPVRAYLVRAVKNRCINHLQLEHERREINFSVLEDNETSCPDIPDTDDSPLAKLLENELEDEINKAINQLPQACKAVFEKNRFEEKTYEEISSEMNISVNTVKYHIKNALELLRDVLAKYL